MKAIDENLKDIPLITIGMPVYNGDNFLKRRLNNILEQTFTNFKLIISDNASSDKTQNICEEYSRKDKRIHYVRQEKNMGILRNFNYVLQRAKSKYFVWAAVDDIWLSEFLEKNVKVLDVNEKVVGSISKIKYTNENGSFIDYEEVDYRKYPITGSYEDKVTFYLKVKTIENIYALYRRDELSKCVIRKANHAVDNAMILNVLKFGDIIVLDDVLMYRNLYGISSETNIIKRFHQFNDYGLVGNLFPFLPFTCWCVKNVGIRFFLKNLTYFVKTNFHVQNLLGLAYLNVFKNKIFHKT